MACPLALLTTLALQGQAPVAAMGVIRLLKRDPDYQFRFRPEYRVAGQGPGPRPARR